MADIGGYEMYAGDDLDWMLKDKLDKMQKIAEKMPELFGRPDYRTEIKGLEHELKDMEMSAQIMAGYEKDENGKNKYNNEGQRKVRATRVLIDNDDYRAKKFALSELKDRQHEIIVDKQVMDGELNILKIIIPALTKIYERETIILKHKERINVERTD